MAVVKKPWSDRAGMGCAILFLLPFAATGVTCAVMAVWHMWCCWDAQSSWTERPCTIVRAELKAQHGEGTTYKVEAEYQYEFNDQPFTGDRVWFGTGSDNISGFHENAHRELEQCQKQGRPFRCFVDPNDPASSVLYRDVRFEMVGFLLMFVLVFGGVGVGGLCGLVYVSRQTRRMNDARELRPSEPWTWDERLQDGMYRPQASWVGIVLIALFWNSTSWTGDTDCSDRGVEEGLLVDVAFHAVPGHRCRYGMDGREGGLAPIAFRPARIDRSSLAAVLGRSD